MPEGIYLPCHCSYPHTASRIRTVYAPQVEKVHKMKIVERSRPRLRLAPSRESFARKSGQASLRPVAEPENLACFNASFITTPFIAGPPFIVDRSQSPAGPVHWPSPQAPSQT